MDNSGGVVPITAESLRQRKEITECFARTVVAVQTHRTTEEFYEWAKNISDSEFAAIYGMIMVVGQWEQVFRVAFEARDTDALIRESDARQAEVRARSANDKPV